METIEIIFPSTWSLNQCNEWMIEKQLCESSSDIVSGTYTFKVPAKERWRAGDRCTKCQRLNYNCVCEIPE